MKSFNIRDQHQSISWSNDDLPSLGGGTPLPVALSGKADVTKASSSATNFPRIECAQVLSAHRLELVSGWCSGQLARRGRGKKSPQSARISSWPNGAKVMVYGEVADSIQGAPQPLYKRPRFFADAQWDAYGGRLTAFAQHTLAHGVRVAYHHHMGAYVETPADVDALMARAGDAVGLLLTGPRSPAACGGSCASTARLPCIAGRAAGNPARAQRQLELSRIRNQWRIPVPGDGA
jgi:inosose dehydratase